MLVKVEPSDTLKKIEVCVHLNINVHFSITEDTVLVSCKDTILPPEEDYTEHLPGGIASLFNAI